jgi:hypothetical protein
VNINVNKNCVDKALILWDSENNQQWWLSCTFNYIVHPLSMKSSRTISQQQKQSLIWAGIQSMKEKIQEWAENENQTLKVMCQKDIYFCSTIFITTGITWSVGAKSFSWLIVDFLMILKPSCSWVYERIDSFSIFATKIHCKIHAYPMKFWLVAAAYAYWSPKVPTFSACQRLIFQHNEQSQLISKSWADNEAWNWSRTL